MKPPRPNNPRPESADPAAADASAPRGELDSHWLWRFSAETWLQAAQNELAAAQKRKTSRRACVSHCRRAAGMALNAVLVRADAGRLQSRYENFWGRSYMDHLRAINADPSPLPPSAAASAGALLEISPLPPAKLVQIRTRGPDAQDEALHHSELLLALSRAFVLEGSKP